MHLRFVTLPHHPLVLSLAADKHLHWLLSLHNSLHTIMDTQVEIRLCGTKPLIFKKEGF